MSNASRAFMAYTPQDYCPRCRTDTKEVTRTLCRPGLFKKATCDVNEKHGDHIHCSCILCGREWIMACPPVPAHMHMRFDIK